MTTAIVFGGTGFVGRHLVASLVDTYDEVVAADLEIGARRVPGVRYVACDVRQPIDESVSPIPPDVVYNLAAVHRVPGHEDREYHETNEPGASNVTDFCRKAGTRSLVFTSSISVYGPSEEAKDEEATPAPVTAYGRSKWAAEGVHREWVDEEPDRQLVIVRPAVIFGEGERGNFTRLAAALRGRRFVYPGRRDTVKGCGYVGELVSSMAYALTLGRRQFLYNLCYPRPYTIEEICEAFHDVGDLPRPLGTLPFGAMRRAGRAFDRLADAGLRTGIGEARILKLVLSTHIEPHALLEAGYTFETDLREGLRRWRAASPDFV